MNVVAFLTTSVDIEKLALRFGLHFKNFIFATTFDAEDVGLSHFTYISLTIPFTQLNIFYLVTSHFKQLMVASKSIRPQNNGPRFSEFACLC